MIKSNKADWTLSENQCHAKGILEGIAIGMLLMFAVMTMSFIAFVLVD